MNVLAIIGSPRKNGNTAAIVNAVCRGAVAVGHEVEIINVNDLTIHDCVGCNACKTGKIEYCVLNDDMQKLYPKIVTADCLVVGTPVYVGQMTGKMKNFFDRWYAFLDENHQLRHFPGEKYITVTSSGGPAEAFQSLTDYFNYWLGDFFQMKLVKNIVAGTLQAVDDINKQPEILQLAEKTGREL
ncbi:flavodoxin family protein [Pelosinus sp. sgz500959]|uniref:flavodoxin family protein n=1 Tax=Pelosinus sp. sgz500959 TaxID=3242472 RepID=UPI0036734767